MPKYKYNPNNTEGHYPTSIDFIDTEIKKGNKIIATDLVDLYDTYPETITPNEGDALKYDGNDGIWKPGEGVGTSCSIFIGYNEFNNGYSHHSLFIDENTISPGKGTLNNPFLSLKDAFTWLNKCIIIPDEITLTIYLLSNIHIYEETSLNHPQGHNIIIDGRNHYIQSEITIETDNSNSTDLINVSSITTSNNHSLLLKSDNTLWGTGYNDDGQLGFENRSNNNSLNYWDTRSIYNTYWKKISCGNKFSIVIKEDGTLWATGLNDKGQLGLGDNINRNVFTQIGTDTDWKQVACGDEHTLALKEDGTLWATGLNSLGQLGLGNTNNRNIFVQVGTDNDWIFITCGQTQSFAIKSTGTLWGCGNNIAGELGLGNSGFGTNRIFFTQIGNKSDWVYVSSGNNHTVALDSNNSLWSTGNNFQGQLGLGDRIERHTFTQIVGNYWKSVSCGGGNTIALRTDNTLWGCGDNYYGQLGLGYSSNYRTVFTQEYRSDTDWIKAECQQFHTIALKNDGTVWSSGFILDGGLGIEKGSEEKTNKFIRSKQIKPKIINNPLLRIFSNHTLKEIKNISLKSIIHNNNNVQAPLIMYLFDINTFSSCLFNNISIEEKLENDIYNGSIRIINKSLVTSENMNTNKILLDNACMIVDEIGNIEIDLRNDSTLIIKNTPLIYPTVDNYESTYIVAGVMH